MSFPALFDPASLTVRGLPRRLVPFVLGYEPIAESISIRGGDPSRYLLEPVTAAAVVYDGCWVLLDTGFNVDIVRDPVRRAEHFNYDSYTAVVPPGDPLRQEVARLAHAPEAKNILQSDENLLQCPTGQSSHVSLSLSLSLSVHLHVHPSNHPFMYLSIHLST